MPLPRRLAALTTAVCTVVGGLAITVAAAGPAAASSSASAFVADINAARSAAGLRPYAVASDVAAVAQHWAEHMAAAGGISHNPALESAIDDWEAVGENVGMGPDVSSINSAFLHSAPHRANILDHDFTQVGVGTAVGSDGTLYVVEDFREPMPSASSRPAPAPAPAPQPAPTRAPATHHSAPAPTHAATGVPAGHAQPARQVTDAAAAAAAARLRAAQALAATLRAAHHAPHGASDPVARAVSFAHTMAALSG